MAFSLSDEHEAIRAAVREFGENEIQPVAEEHDREGKYPEELRRTAAEYDFVAPSIPVEYGGAGMDKLSKTIVTEELWRADPGIGSAVGSAGFGTNMIVEFGDDWMKEEWLPKIASGEVASCSCISEPAHGSNVSGIETVAEKDGDEYILNGNKMWITNGTVADIGVVMAKTSPGERHRGITAFLLPMDTDGISTEKIDNKLGIRASDLAEVVIDDVRIPEENVIGEVDEGSTSSWNSSLRAEPTSLHRPWALRRARSTLRSSTLISANSSTRRSPSSRPSSTKLPRWPPRSRRLAR